MTQTKKKYVNKTKYKPSSKEIIHLLLNNNVDFILIGSEVGKIYNLCDNKKDIDLLINPSIENKQKLFNTLNQYFKINWHEFNTLDRIYLISSDMPIELFVKARFMNDFISYKPNFVDFYGSKIKILNKKDYILSIETAIIYYKEFINSDHYYLNKVNKYKKIINNYNKGENCYD